MNNTQAEKYGVKLIQVKIPETLDKKMEELGCKKNSIFIEAVKWFLATPDLEIERIPRKKYGSQEPGPETKKLQIRIPVELYKEVELELIKRDIPLGIQPAYMALAKMYVERMM